MVTVNRTGEKLDSNFENENATWLNGKRKLNKLLIKLSSYF